MLLNSCGSSDAGCSFCQFEPFHVSTSPTLCGLVRTMSLISANVTASVAFCQFEPVHCTTCPTLCGLVYEKSDRPSMETAAGNDDQCMLKSVPFIFVRYCPVVPPTGTGYPHVTSKSCPSDFLSIMPTAPPVGSADPGKVIMAE